MYAAQTWGMSNPKQNKSNNTSLTFWQRLQKAATWADVPSAPKDIAKELDIYPSAVTKYIDGKFPKKEHINTLAKRRKVRSEWLLSGLGEMVAEDALDEETLELLRLWRALDPDAKGRFLANMRYEHTAALTMNTGKRQALTEDLIRLLEAQRRDQ